MKSIALLCLATAIGAAAQQPTPAPEPPGFSAADLHHAREFAQNSGLPPPEIARMEALLDQADHWQHSSPPQQPPDMELVVPFLVKWITGSRHLAPARRADALYAADILLGLPPLHVDEQTASLRAQLATVGAHFNYDELVAGYDYRRDWMRQAFRVAPDSEAGQEAFLFLLNTSLNPEYSCNTEAFNDVIALAPPILKQHPHWAIRAEVLLAIGDAYRDIIAVANGVNSEAFEDAAKYKKEVPHARREALRCYRAAIAAAPHSEAANKAQKKARDLEAGITPNDMRFFCYSD